ESRPAPAPVVPRSAAYYAERLTLVGDAAAARALAELARQLPLARVGIDFEFTSTREPVFIKKTAAGDHYWQDPPPVVPLLRPVPLVGQPRGGAARLPRFVVDCRAGEAAAALPPLLPLPVPFVCHFARAELFCLWRLGLPAPEQLWDSWAAERAFQLGLHHANYVNERPRDEAEEAEAEEAAEEAAAAGCGLVASCLRRGVAYPFAGDKERLQKSFLDH